VPIQQVPVQPTEFSGLYLRCGLPDTARLAMSVEDKRRPTLPYVCRPIRTLVVDDAAIMRETLCAFLETQDNIEVVGTADDGREAQEKVAWLSPELVLMDVEMAEMNGLDAARAIVRRFPQVRIIFLTVHDNAETRTACVESGGHGFVSKAHLHKQLPQEISRLFAVSPAGS